MVLQKLELVRCTKWVQVIVILRKVERWFQKPHPMEPKYVAQGRKKILMEDRQKGRITETQCQALLIELESTLEEKEKVVSFLASLLWE